VKVQLDSIPDNIKVKVFADCDNDGTEIESQECNDVESDATVNYL
jgi:hypothetical protein